MIVTQSGGGGTHALQSAFVRLVLLNEGCNHERDPSCESHVLTSESSYKEYQARLAAIQRLLQQMHLSVEGLKTASHEPKVQ